MFRFKHLLTAVLGLALSVAIVHAKPPSPDTAQPNPNAPLTDQSNGKNLSERSLTAMSEAADKIGDVISTGVQAFGSGVQRVTDQASILIQHARETLGVRYRWGGTSTETGFDCSGFVRAMVQQTIGKLLPHHAADQAAVTQKISKDELKPGDLVFFNTVRRRAYSHVGIYMGDGQFIHAPARGESVRIDNLSATYWQKHFEGARRVLTGQSSGYSLASADTSGLGVSKAVTPSANLPDAQAMDAAFNAALDDNATDRPDRTAGVNVAHAASNDASLISTPFASTSTATAPAQSTARPKSGHLTKHARHRVAKNGNTGKRSNPHHGGKVGKHQKLT
jgi:cell wall-associated NlpC family hydrolase